jgi:hypothetical protein
MKDFSILERSIQRKPIVPTIIRESICWTSVDDDTVQVCLDVINMENVQSDELDLHIEAAPFGAFVPGSPVATIAVGILEPGESRNFTVRLNRQILNELGLADVLEEFARSSGAAAIMAPSRNRQWIGNLNVYFDRDPASSVERHRAFNLCVPVGIQLSCMFIIKDPGPCECEVESTSTDWEASISNTQFGPIPDSQRRLASSNFGRPGRLAQVPSMARRDVRMISIKTSNRIGDQANITVSVKRLRDNKIVPVEFEFRTVEGWGQSVGCIRVD